ncbi:hypothetical protein FMM05_19990 [Flavobacterium zepuense]|uniref:Uncharacterized protein n=1 Tax=Flavobacterium zepuense TaxID=2593302 RepID=A0A552UTR9_9FLAO|nr:hypothetical protein [Flavobacterium zepuense]TRW21540.1 hypothetical protein FMM05_19990 [Flavobacterium zepuense]
MSIIITYTGEIQKFKDAVSLANKIVVDVAFYDIIVSRQTPFDESVPSDISPIVIAELFGSIDLDLTLKEYKRPQTVGGAFDPDYPTTLWGNVNALHRSSCNLASMLVHECVHALSYHSKEYNFSHDSQEPKYNQQTAPYWIGNKVRDHYCNNGVIEIAVEEPLIIETNVPIDSIVDVG